MLDILKKINKIGSVKGSLVIGADGLVIASDLSGSQDAGELAAVASSVSAALDNALTRLNAGHFDRFIMNGSDGSLVLQQIDSAILLTLVRKDANMGMVLVELKEAAQSLSERTG